VHLSCEERLCHLKGSAQSDGAQPFGLPDNPFLRGQRQTRASVRKRTAASSRLRARRRFLQTTAAAPKRITRC
jgi:hypothetical protein